MLRTVVIYEGDGREMPIIETRELALAKLVAEAALREFAEAISRCDDPVLREVITTEGEQVRRVLRAAGLAVRNAH